MTSMRNATLADLAVLLQQQHARKIDLVAPASKIRAEGGLIRVTGAEPIIDEDGVTEADGLYRPTAVFDEGVSEKLGIPIQYLRRMRDQRPDLYDANVNGWLHGRKAKYSGPVIDGGTIVREAVPGDDRSFLFRAFRGDQGDGVARALLSDTYKMIDHLDALTAALDGVRQAGVHVEIDGCDLSDRRMYVRIVAPEVQALAPALLANYRSPFTDPHLDEARRHAALDHGWYEPSTEPVLFAGFVISNSEVGGGAFSITPRIVVQVCKNGLTVTKDALRAVHLGGKLDEGLIRWSDDTQRLSLDLVTAKTRDAVATFLDVDYVQQVVAGMEAAAGKRVTDAPEVVKQVGKTLQFDQATITGVLDHFIRGGDLTAGGVMQAVTSYAQTVPSPDTAYDLEAAAFRALTVAAGL